MKTTKITIIAAALTGMLSTPGFAQDADQDEATPSGALLEEIIVTARKREESLMEIPISVAILDNQLIEAANLTSIEDVARATPGFKVNSAFGRQGDRPVVRGVAGISTGVELAGYFVDGVYVSGTLQSFDLGSIQQIEILKGPQSAAFGRRTFAGAVNYITKLPEEGRKVKLKAELGSNSLRTLAATFSGRNDNWGYRANIRSYKYDGDFDNTLSFGPQDVGGEETTSFNGTLYFTPTDATKIQLNVLVAKDDDEQYGIALQGSDQNNCFFGSERPRPYYCGELQGDTPISLGGFLPSDSYGVEQDRFRSSMRVDHDYGAVQLMSITAYNTNDYSAVQDQTFAGLQTAFSFATFGQVPASDWHTSGGSETDSFSQEFWLNGQSANDKLDWSTGIYFFDEESQDIEEGGFRNDIQNIALMGALDYAFSDKFKAGIELRYAEDEIQEKPSGSDDVFEETFDSLTYRATASWFVSDSTMVYGNVSTGTLPGFFNTNRALPEELIAVDEGELQQFELGVKSSVSDKLDITAAVYNQEWKDQIRSQFIIIDGTPESYQANQGTTDFNGFEFTANWHPTERLTLTGAVSLNDSEVNDFVSSDATDVAITGDGDVSGAQLPLSPEEEFYASITYNHPLANGYEISTRFDWAYQGSRFVRLPNLAETGSSSVVNATINIGSDDSNWKYTLWGRNLTDEDAPVSGLRYLEADSFFFSGRAFALTPRRGTEFGISASVEF